MTSFQDQWAPTWEVQKTIPRAKACVIENTGRAFKTGRPIVDAVFFDANRREICRRQGMTLTSKKGHEYVVCLRQTSRREPDQAATQAPPATAVGELFDDL